MAATEISINPSPTDVGVADLIGPVLHRLSVLAPRPSSIEASGLSPEMLASLVLKHLLMAGSLTSGDIGERLGLVGTVLEPIFQFLRQEGCVQLQTRASVENEVRLTFTDRGRQAASDAMKRCGYVGPAPVPLGTYTRIARGQTVRRRTLARDKVTRAFSNIVMAEDLCDRIGVAMGSGRAIFIYGPAGSGKTYIASRLISALSGEILIPHAIAVNERIVRIFDAAVHERIELLDGNQRLLLAQG